MWWPLPFVASLILLNFGISSAQIPESTIAPGGVFKRENFEERLLEIKRNTPVT